MMLGARGLSAMSKTSLAPGRKNKAPKVNVINQRGNVHVSNNTNISLFIKWRQ
ncbi:hypothetical protein SAMN02745132_03474 [Enterovibrio nigricans DSM 22720]|uniref:Uncharacterized protein n=1 Tax=Enterovibrio nigricans DSM 22720 TaxID=1121868 RepID=A0A1T4V8U1_9GAMM|nr:hypothetical protein SAMN02745132_03474 [Enterovibrio nigricans DSM 22720]